MNKYLSQEEKNTLKLEFAYQGQSSGMMRKKNLCQGKLKSTK